MIELPVITSRAAIQICYEIIKNYDDEETIIIYFPGRLGPINKGFSDPIGQVGFLTNKQATLLQLEGIMKLLNEGADFNTAVMMSVV